MKTLKNHLILFDAECPMCKVYTRAFVSTGLLEEAGRAAYQELTPQACTMLDRQRAVNEIALINQETGEVTYGIESLFKVFGQAMPFLKPLFASGPFVWFMRKVYAFIAFNRRVIIPAATNINSYQLQPEFRLKLPYRLPAVYVGSCILYTFCLCKADERPAAARPYLQGVPYMRRPAAVPGYTGELIKSPEKMGLPGQHDDRILCGCFAVTAGCDAVTLV